MSENETEQPPPTDVDTQPPPPPDPEERVTVKLDRFEQRMDNLEDRLDNVGSDSQEALKLLHAISGAQTRAEIEERRRHKNLDIVLNRIERNQDAQQIALKRHGEELAALRRDDELLRTRIDELSRRLDELAIRENGKTGV